MSIELFHTANEAGIHILLQELFLLATKFGFWKYLLSFPGRTIIASLNLAWRYAHWNDARHLLHNYKERVPRRKFSQLLLVAWSESIVPRLAREREAIDFLTCEFHCWSELIMICKLLAFAQKSGIKEISLCACANHKHNDTLDIMCEGKVGRAH